MHILYKYTYKIPYDYYDNDYSLYITNKIKGKNQFEIF